jgi:hypothetical protein
VKDTLDVQADAFEEKYLRLPTLDGRMHKGKFQNLQEWLTMWFMLWGDGLPLRWERNFY